MLPNHFYITSIYYYLIFKFKLSFDTLMKNHITFFYLIKVCKDNSSIKYAKISSNFVLEYLLHFSIILFIDSLTF